MSDEEFDENLTVHSDDGELPLPENDGWEPDSELPDDWDRADHDEQYGGGLKRLRQPDRIW
jgi:hypothetical protein